MGTEKRTALLFGMESKAVIYSLNSWAQSHRSGGGKKTNRKGVGRQNHNCAFQTRRKNKVHSCLHAQVRRAENFPRKTAATKRPRPQQTTPHPRIRLARAPDYLDAHREQQFAITMYEPKNVEERHSEVPWQPRVLCTKQRRSRAITCKAVRTALQWTVHWSTFRRAPHPGKMLQSLLHRQRYFGQLAHSTPVNETTWRPYSSPSKWSVASNVQIFTAALEQHLTMVTCKLRGHSSNETSQPVHPEIQGKKMVPQRTKHAWKTGNCRATPLIPISAVKQLAWQQELYFASTDL